MQQKEDSKLVSYFNHSFRDFLNVAKNLIKDCNESIKYLENFKSSENYGNLQISQQNTINKSVECYAHMKHIDWTAMIPVSVSSEAEINGVFNSIYKKLILVNENIGFKNYLTALCWATSRLPSLQDLLSDEEGKKIIATKMIKPIQTPTHLLSSFEAWEKKWLSHTDIKSESLTSTIVMLKKVRLAAENLLKTKSSHINKMKSSINLLSKTQAYLDDPYYFSANKKITQILLNNLGCVSLNAGVLSDDDPSDEELPEPPKTTHFDIPSVPMRQVELPHTTEKTNTVAVKTIKTSDNKKLDWPEIMQEINKLHQNIKTSSQQTNTDIHVLNQLNDQYHNIFETINSDFPNLDKSGHQIAQGYLAAINELLTGVKQKQLEAILLEYDVSVVQTTFEDALANYHHNLSTQILTNSSQRFFSENSHLLSTFHLLSKSINEKVDNLEAMKALWVEQTATIDKKMAQWSTLKNRMDSADSTNETSSLQKELLVFMGSDLNAESLNSLIAVHAQWHNKINNNKNATSFAQTLVSNVNRLVGRSIASQYKQALAKLDVLFTTAERYTKTHTEIHCLLSQRQNSVLDKLNSLQAQTGNYKNLLVENFDWQETLVKLQDLNGLHKPEDLDFERELKLREDVLVLRSQQVGALGNAMLDTIGNLLDEQRAIALDQTKPGELTTDNFAIVNHAIFTQFISDPFLQERLEGYNKFTVKNKIDRFARHNQAISRRSEVIQSFERKLSSNTDYEKNSFINTLKLAFQSYACSGNIRTVLAKIEEGKKEFSDVTFQSILNKIAVEIMDEEDGRPFEMDELEVDLILPEINLPAVLHDIDHSENSPEPILPPIFSVVSIQDQATTILQTLNNFGNTSKKKYAAYLLDLYARSEKFLGEASHLLDDKKEHVEILHAGLIKDISEFVCQNRYNLPTEAKLKRFNDKLNYRLHSEDDKLEVHTTSSLVRFVANLVINLMGLCVPLAVTSLVTGRYATFYNATLREQNRDEIDSIKNEMWEHRATICG